ncbi:endophilin-B1-like [Narcine bancroftii]|uniref:endophilin-B1-like n=1 Tax=Narcine bancroftii TaxID=1343680 RepID=UPI003831FC77
MEHLTWPEELDIDPQSATTFKAFKFWLLNFENFLKFIWVEEDNQRLTALLSMVSLRVYENIQDETTYTTAIKFTEEMLGEAEKTELDAHLAYRLGKAESTK